MKETDDATIFERLFSGKRKKEAEAKALLLLEHENVNYKKLLLMALLSAYENEGACWYGQWRDGDYGLSALTEEEKREIDNLVENYVTNRKFLK